MLVKKFVVESFDTVAEHNRVRNLHHCSLEVQREQHTFCLGVCDLTVVELAEQPAAHESSIEHLAREQREFLFEHGHSAICGDVFDACNAGLFEADRLFMAVEVAVRHGRHMGRRVRRPLAHGVRVPEGVLLHGHGRPAVGVALAQHGVHGAAQHLAVAGLDLLLGLVLGLLGVVRQRVALRLELRDAGLELGDGGADVGQLDDVGVRRLGELAKLREDVRHPLLAREALRELRDDAAGHRDVLELDAHARVLCESRNDGVEGVGRQHGRLVGVGVHDGGRHG
mmetsp:Transcript_22242/g.70087  ORF Transcript_22242/g.70087 Transcript_22242/m.70087 type:complete len:283 (+) Transcript_22242:388-1236(+)